MRTGKKALILVSILALLCLSFSSFTLALAANPSGDEKEKVTKVLEGFRQGWNNLDVEALKKGFDKDYEHLVYLPTEMEKPITTWKDLEKYFADGVAFFSKIEFIFKELTMDFFGDVAFVFCGYDFNYQAKGNPDVVKSKGHLTFLLRKKGDDWLIIHYHESVPSVASSSSQEK